MFGVRVVRGASVHGRGVTCESGDSTCESDARCARARSVDQTRAARARSAPPRSSTCGGASRGADLARAARV